MRLFQVNKQIHCLAGGRLFCTGGFLGVPLEAQGGPYALFKLTKVEKVKIPVVFFALCGPLGLLVGEPANPRCIPAKQWICLIKFRKSTKLHNEKLGAGYTKWCMSFS